MSSIFVQPARGADGKPLLVRDPQTRLPLADAGEWKTDSAFWRRRIRDGDVIDRTVIAARSGAASKAAPPAAEPAPTVTSQSETPRKQRR